MCTADMERRFASFTSWGAGATIVCMDATLASSTEPSAATAALSAPRPTGNPVTPGLPLPCTGQALRTALQRRDLRTLDELTRHLRVAGYRFDPVSLATELLQHGCASVVDAFDHLVPVHVRVPPRATAPVPRDESQAFSIAL
jgi:hypothetical protein